MSLPVVVTVHCSQEVQSWATITWDNAFSKNNRVPFYVVDTVNWSHMVDALKFKYFQETGRRLTDDNLSHLCEWSESIANNGTTSKFPVSCIPGEKAFRGTVNSDPNDRPITWSQFCKEPLPQRTFTFWDWFYAAMKLTKDKLRDQWKKDLIVGFISRRQTEEKLMNSTPGTFLLRFSDSVIGEFRSSHPARYDGMFYTLNLLN